LLESDTNVSVHASSVLALALATTGETTRARAIAASARGMYADEAIASVAAACAAARDGDATDAGRAIQDAREWVAPTQDRLTAAIVAVARAQVLGVLGDAGAAEA